MRNAVLTGETIPHEPPEERTMLTPTVTEISRGSAHRHHADDAGRTTGLRGFHDVRMSPRSAPSGGALMR